jgi:phospholipase/carboxylesterase
MIHGHLGNEDVMWIFAQTLPFNWLLVSVRAVVPVSENSFTWLPRAENEWLSLGQFDEAVTKVAHFIQALPELYEADLEQIYLMGFSQGAATSFATAVAHPGWIKGIASLVGFMPLQVEDPIEKSALMDVPVFMAAGEQDERIPIEMSRVCAEAVRAMGAHLEYREYNTGHKLNSDGMRKLKAWWLEREKLREIHRHT